MNEHEMWAGSKLYNENMHYWTNWVREERLLRLPRYYQVTYPCFTVVDFNLSEYGYLMCMPVDRQN